MPRILKDDHTGRLHKWVDAFPTPIAGAEHLFPDLDWVDRDEIPGMLAHLRDAEKYARELRRRLEGHYLATRPPRRAPLFRCLE